MKVSSQLESNGGFRAAQNVPTGKTPHSKVLLRGCCSYPACLLTQTVLPNWPVVATSTLPGGPRVSPQQLISVFLSAEGVFGPAHQVAVQSEAPPKPRCLPIFASRSPRLSIFLRCCTAANRSVLMALRRDKAGILFVCYYKSIWPAAPRAIEELFEIPICQ